MNSASKFILSLCVVYGLCFGFDISVVEEQKVNLIMSELSDCSFDSAHHAIEAMIASDSSDPLHWMLLMAEITLRQLDYGQVPDSDSFQAAFDKAKAASADYKRQNGNNSYILTIDAYSQLIGACATMQKKKYISGLKRGLEALSLCKEVKKIDSSNVEVDFIVGLYNYARAELNRKFLGILFWYSGDKLSGIRAIENCSRGGQLFSRVADMVLQEIYVKEQLFEKAMAGIDRQLTLSPANRFVLWTKAKLFDARNLPAQAGETYKQLADAYGNIPEAKKNYFSTRLCQVKRFHEASLEIKASDACKQLLSSCKGEQCDECREAEKLFSKIKSAKD
jgi:hypothetical protein